MDARGREGRKARRYRAPDSGGTNGGAEAKDDVRANAKGKVAPHLGNLAVEQIRDCAQLHIIRALRGVVGEDVLRRLHKHRSARLGRARDIENRDNKQGPAGQQRHILPLNPKRFFSRNQPTREHCLRAAGPLHVQGEARDTIQAADWGRLN